jgi:hypothetical protein
LSVSASGEGTGSGGGVSYSVGQTFYIANAGSTGSENQGMQQPYEVSVVFIAKEVAINQILVTQNANGLSIDLENPNSAKFSYQILNLNGEILAENSLHEVHNLISMDSYSHMIYYIKISRNGNLLKSFQVNKKAIK